MDIEERKEICEETRTHLGTPYHHQGRLKKIGEDCAGVIFNVARAVNRYKGGDYTDYSMLPDGYRMQNTLRTYAGKEKSINDMQAGDILLMRFATDPQHLAILVEDGYIIHSYLRMGKVVKEQVKQYIDNKQVISVFEFPEKQ